MTGAPPVGSHPWRPRAWYIVKGVRMEMMHMSPALPRLLGCEPADLTGTKMTDLLHPEERALAQEDYSAFLNAATLHGCATRCRLFHKQLQDYLVVEIANNVVCHGLVLCSIAVLSAPLHYRIDRPPTQTLMQNLQELYASLQLVPRTTPELCRSFMILDSDSLRVLLVWPPENAERIYHRPIADLHQATLDDLASPIDAPSVVRDVRTFQSSVRPDQIARCYNRHGVNVASSAPVHLEAVLDLQDDCVFVTAQPFTLTSPPPPPPNLRTVGDPRFPLAGALLLHQQHQAAAAAAAASHLQPAGISPHPVSVATPKRCATCKTSESPEWRKGPSGDKTLCNACGLRYSRSLNRSVNRKKESSMLT